jgi:GH35 family endo-1,4-beta-xylanase
MVKHYCRIVKWLPECVEIASNFDGYFVHNDFTKYPEAAPTIVYLDRVKNSQELDTIFEHWGAFNPEIIIFANEIFLDNGKLRGKEDKDWIVKRFWQIKQNYPNSELWITDHSPQKQQLWNGLRAFISEMNLPVDGIGVHCYLELDRPVPVHVTIAAYLAAISIQTSINKTVSRVAFSEVGIYPKPDGEGLVDGYNAILGLSNALNVEWLNFWFLTDFDSWHWNTQRVRDCGLFDRNYQLKEGLKLWH